MAQIKFNWTITIDDVDSATLPISKTKTLTFTSIEDKTYSIASGTANTLPVSTTPQVVWDPGTDGSETSANFDFLVVMSDQDVYLEMVTDTSGAQDDVNIVEVFAGIPFILGSDDGVGAYGADVTGFKHASAASVTIERLRIGNVSGSTAIVRVIIGD